MKRGQVTTFVIVGVVFIIAIAIFILFSKTALKEPAEIEP